MLELKGSRTEANLYSAYAGESQAMVKYLIYGEKARREGMEGIAAIFDETSWNEKAHAAVWLRYLHGGTIKETLANLKDAQAGEEFEWSSMYADYAKTAREEGFEEIARKFELVGQVEKHHDQRYQQYIQQLMQQKVFKRDQPITWICRNCGFLYTGTTPPKICPVCSHEQGYFEPHQPVSMEKTQNG